MFTLADYKDFRGKMRMWIHFHLSITQFIMEEKISLKIDADIISIVSEKLHPFHYVMLIPQ